EDGPVEGRAPGADDNASGALAVMTAADLLAGHTFDRTLRFLLFTGEEQGLVGSAAYAQDSKDAGEDVVAVLNMDMIGWDDNDDGALYLETRRTSSAGYPADLAIANVFVQVISSYGLDSVLEPHIDPCSDAYVDSWSFWSIGIPSVTAIEDWDWEELNPYPHTAGDTVSTLNLEYYTYNVKAVAGTAAHLALLVDADDYDHAIYLPLVYKKHLR
ncbi:MAG TPA: M28 family peptidase, partial [Anaerolineae bacterium]|nr:M28 family peptidase [Anaerolineae bacterium]